jgi:Rrf2 family iron-sulfur cluster assembly transcriptional regulator
MRLTRAAEYAIRCILYLAKIGRGQQASRKDIARYAEIPPHFLAKIAQDLARAGLIEIRQGAKGGFSLLKDPRDITLLEIVETMIGEIYLNDCVARPSSCNALDACAVHQVWLKARIQLRDTLREVTFDKLIRDKTCIPLAPTKLAPDGTHTRTDLPIT